MACKNPEDHKWINGDYFPFLRCIDCGQKGRVVIL